MTLWFVLGVLAVWRVTHLLHLEHGPWGMLARGRAAAERIGLGDLVHCFVCLSLWAALPVAWWLTATWPEFHQKPLTVGRHIVHASWLPAARTDKIRRRIEYLLWRAALKCRTRLHRDAHQRAH
jgi:hypothetical protein